MEFWCSEKRVDKNNKEIKNLMVEINRRQIRV